MRAGEPYPLGATFDGQGTNFSVFSRVAERVELCLFDERGRESRISLPEMTGHSWHGYLPRVGPGHRYGYRVHGPWDPAAGLRCNPHKLLLDPYARAIDGAILWGPAIFGQDLAQPSRRARWTAPRSCRVPSSPGTTSTGAMTRGRASPITTRSSTRCTSRASRCATRACHRPFGARMPAWPTRQPSRTFVRWV